MNTELFLLKTISFFFFAAFRLAGFRLATFRFAAFRLAGFRLATFRLAGFLFATFLFAGLRFLTGIILFLFTPPETGGVLSSVPKLKTILFVNVDLLFQIKIIFLFSFKLYNLFEK